MRLSKNFTLKEFARSGTAQRMDINNTPSQEKIQNIKDLVGNLLQPLRDRINSTITINSGYRCRVLNQAVGGAFRSQHTQAQAADIDVTSITLKELFKIIYEEFEYDKLIYEYSEWIHISYDKTNNRKITLVAKKINGTTVYQKYNGEL